MADEKPGDIPEPAEIDIEAVDDLPQEDVGKVLRGEIEPPRKGKPPEKDAGTKDEFDVDPKSETVPHGQFHRVNERRKAAEAETAKERQAREQIEQQNAILSQRFKELLEASKPAAPAKEETPEPEEPGPEPDAVNEPYEYGIWHQKWRRYNDHKAEKQRAQQTEAQLQEEQVNRWTEEAERDFSARVPDYSEARTFFWNQRGPELMAVGFTKEQAIQTIVQDERAIRDAALQRRQNPAEAMYNIAKIRGYRPTIEGEAIQPNGAERPRDAEGKFTAAAAAMDKREQTKQAAKSLGGSGGPSDGGEITPQMVADMSEEEFAAFKKKYGDNAMRKVMGASR